jgi:hypothetical protein
MRARGIGKLPTTSLGKPPVADGSIQRSRGPKVVFDLLPTLHPDDLLEDFEIDSIPRPHRLARGQGDQRPFNGPGDLKQQGSSDTRSFETHMRGFHRAATSRAVLRPPSWWSRGNNQQRLTGSLEFLSAPQPFDIHPVGPCVPVRFSPEGGL